MLSVLAEQTSAAFVFELPLTVTPPVVLESDTDDVLTALVLLTLGFLYGLKRIYDGTDRYRKYALIRDTPTERVQSIALGRTELEGTAQPVDEPLDAPFTDQQCLYASWEIQGYTRSGKNKTWSTLDTGTYGVPFYLAGETGKVLVDDPSDATATLSDSCRAVETVGSRTDPGESIASFCDRQGLSPTPRHRRRYIQEILEPESGCYVLGSAVERDEPAGPRNQDRIVIQRDDGSGRFILSDKDEQELTSHYRKKTLLSIPLGIVLSASCLYFWLRLARSYGFDFAITATLAGGVLYAVLYFFERVYREIRYR